MTGLSVARQPGGPGTQSAVARLANYGDQPARVGLSLFVDDVLSDRRDVDLAAKGQTVAAFEVPAGVRRVAVKLAGGDALPADDFAEVSVDIGFVRRVLLVTRRPEALERALKAIPDLKVDTVSPDRYDGSGAEIVVLDGVVPPTLPSGQLIVVNPPAGPAAAADRAGDPGRPVQRLRPAPPAAPGRRPLGRAAGEGDAVPDAVLGARRGRGAGRPADPGGPRGRAAR